MKKYRNGLQTTRIACTHTHVHRRISHDYLLFDRIAQSFRTSIGKSTGHRKLFKHIHGMIYAQFKVTRQSPSTLHYTIKARTLMRKYGNGLQMTYIDVTYNKKVLASHSLEILFFSIRVNLHVHSNTTVDFHGKAFE